MAHSVVVRHNFETAHRLPHLGGKCENLHGHSWWAEITVSAPCLSSAHTVVEFGAFKRAVREWIDTHLDHGAMLGADDPLLPALRADGTKVFVFGEDWDGARWPTVEAVAMLLAERATLWAEAIVAPDMPPVTHVTRVKVSETHVNAAEWVAPTRPPAVAMGQAARAVGNMGATLANKLRGRLP